MRTLIAMFFSLACAQAQAIDTRKIEPAQVGQLAALLEEEMQPGGRYEFVQERERSAVRAALAEMQRLLAGRASIEELDEDARTALFNAQERANAILTERDRERVVCERTRRIGTHRRDTVCETYGERMERIALTRDRTRRLDRGTICTEEALTGRAMCNNRYMGSNKPVEGPN